MVWAVKFWLPSFSYQAILSSIQDAERTSVSPSPSTSVANTLSGAVRGGGDGVCAKFWLPSFSYQAILSSKVDADNDIHVAIAVDVCRKHAMGLESRRC